MSSNLGPSHVNELNTFFSKLRKILRNNIDRKEEVPNGHFTKIEVRSCHKPIPLDFKFHNAGYFVFIINSVCKFNFLLSLY